MIDRLRLIKHRVGAKVWVAKFNSSKRVRMKDCPACNNTGELIVEPTGFEPFTIACPCTYLGKPYVQRGVYEPVELVIEQIVIGADEHYYVAHNDDSSYSELTEDDIFGTCEDCQEYIDTELTPNFPKDSTNIF